MNTTCPYCGVGCGVVVAAGEISGDPAHPANFGKLCVKGSTLAQTLDDSARLMQPLVGGRAAGWNEALDLVAARFAETVAEYGPDSVAFYGSGQFLTEDYYVANKLMKGFIGSANIDTNSRLCMSSTVAGHMRAFGEDVVPGCYEDIDEADLLVFVGANAAWCHPVLFERAQAARAARGTKIVVIDPRATATTALADLHLKLRPDSDVALFNLLLATLSDRKCLDIGYINAHTENFAAALEAAMAAHVSPEALGVGDAELQTFLAWFCATERTVTLFSQGVNQSVSGTDKVNAIINVHLATGRIGMPGMGPFSLTGQPNAMGGREVGGLANLLAAHLKFENAADRAFLKEFWNVPALPAKPGLKAVDMFDALLNGRVKAIWIAATNPAESMPRAGRVRAALEACPFVVVADCWPTATTRLANVVLPAAGWGEKDGTVTNSERRISRQKPFRAPVGEAKPDWWMFAEVAKRMGFGASFDYAGPAAIFREHAALSGFKNDGARKFDIGALAGLSTEDYDALAPVQWPPGQARVFYDGKFSTASGRARFVAVETPEELRRCPAFPFVLNTGRLRDQWHTMTRTGFVPQLMESAGEANFAIAPADARRFNVADGDLLRITTRQGSAVLPASITAGQRPGEIFAAMHWTDAHSGAGTISALIGPERDPHSGQPAAKYTPVAVEAIPTHWHGIMQSRHCPSAGAQIHFARVPLAGGMHRVRLAGWKPLPEVDALPGWAARLCGADAGDERIEFLDASRGIYRLGLLRGSHLQACLFIVRKAAALPGDAALAALFEANAWKDDRTQILLGRAGGSEPARSRIICVCHGVTETVIRAAIAVQGLHDVASVGRALKAGTNCGSCKGELAQMLREDKMELA
jgi:assimilatory nitrate reductase catalytic subunit